MNTTEIGGGHPAAAAPADQLLSADAEKIWPLAQERGQHQAAWLLKAVMLLPQDRGLCGADVRGAVAEAVEALTGEPKPVAAHAARPAVELVELVINGRAPWLSGDLLDEYARGWSRASVVTVLLAAAMRAVISAPGDVDDAEVAS